MFLRDGIDIFEKLQRMVGDAPLVEVEDISSTSPIYARTAEALPRASV